MFASVLIELKAKNLDKTFTYKVPEALASFVCVGKRVLVPFGSQKLEGFVLKVSDSEDVEYELKDIISVIDEKPVLNSELLELGKYISKKTLSSLISSYQTMLPKALKAHKDFIVNKKIAIYIELKDKEYKPQNSNQELIINELKTKAVLKSKLTKISLSSVNTLLKKGIINQVEKEVYRLNDEYLEEYKKVVLNEEQRYVVDTVCEDLNSFKPYLLHGVTGSGKTEVYMNIIDQVLKLNKNVIVLVPEISLTPQMVSIFKSRFKSKIAILHSALSDGEKYDEWRKVENGEVSIVIGARSAIFAPFNNIGLIVLDEEHSDTYKQENIPKYSAIDVAIKRAKTHSCPIIFGSATPSVESYTRALNGIYTLLELKNRVNKNLPSVSIVDMRDELKKGNKVLSSYLKDAISECLKKEEQVILLLNRRGYSTTIMCSNCGEVLKCPNCDIPLTYHKNGNKLNCHYCNYTTFNPNKCPSCGDTGMTSLGLGTEKLEEIVKETFEDAKIIRMDVDTTRKKGSHERIIRDFKNKKYNILIGTQMISKGLDFEDVTLVGVINGDATLNIPDFRSGERTFSLLNQVAGRAGRSGKIGRVLIQCFNTTHYSIVYASKHEYKSFYLEEMNIRKKMNYPPYYNLALIRIYGDDFDAVGKEANKIRKFLDDNISNVIILGPGVSNMPKLNNKYYMQIILKYKAINQIYDYLKFVLDKNKINKKVSVDIDFNPKKI